MSQTLTKQQNTIKKVLRPKEAIDESENTEQFYNNAMKKAKELLDLYADDLEQKEEDLIVAHEALDVSIRETREKEKKIQLLEQEIQYYRSREDEQTGNKEETQKTLLEMFKRRDRLGERKISEEEKTKRVNELLKKRKNK